MTSCGPLDGVRWLTLPSEPDKPDRVLVLVGDQQRIWPLRELLDQRRQDVGLVSTDDSGNEYVVLHLPDSALFGYSAALS